MAASTCCQLDTVPDSVAKLIVESTDVKVRILRSKVGVVVPPQRSASLPNATLFFAAQPMLVSQPAKANSTGHHRTVSLHTNASPPHLPEFLDPLPYLNRKWRQNYA